MRIVILKDDLAVAEFGANYIIEAINKKPNTVLGLATGSTPIKLYEKMMFANQKKRVCFKKVTTFNLDEYLGLAVGHPQSYRYFMDHHFFNHIDIAKENTFVPNGASDDPISDCSHYERNLREKGGVDLQLLGIGSNGHIGFNEPGSSLASRTRITVLSKETISANKRFFSLGESQPHLSITMGIGTILESREIMLIATGKNKAEAIKNTIEGPVSSSCPASILQMHPYATIVMDEEAAKSLRDIEFYKYTELESQKFMLSQYK
jgi:glucosamine-6-phosphate deaminase|tara:strand:- start:554 stop:1345 length:792 start_codon:yes stop_codon:yes gene_type:complete